MARVDDVASTGLLCASQPFTPCHHPLSTETPPVSFIYRDLLNLFLIFKRNGTQILCQTFQHASHNDRCRTSALQTHFILEEAEAVSIDSAWGGATLFPNHSGGNSMTTVGVIQ